ncbi:hypothetical protein FF38_07220 [Lucilia cuprina]|uniref:Uncharacterized protein n=1 Tax=Lucilia cuprina TaxID=7375 RepID=A0A0L0CGN9_LUCCU|nr:hypothetical protein CVS40_7725 [Lucilia cuprina]KNC31396.1 hypothetical protein FF38_07220 [Lucilia cuprina]
MKIVCVLLLVTLAAVFALPEKIKDPKIFVAGGGNQMDGYDFTANVRKNVSESDNVGGPYGNSPADRRVGGIYSYRW